MTIKHDTAAIATASTTMIVVLHHRDGALERVLGAARRQGCALRTLALEHADHQGLARLSLTVDGGHPARLVRQLVRLVDVIEVHDATQGPAGHTAPRSDVTPTPFRSQADGVSPAESDTEDPKPFTEDR